jgi:hypothetical protein
VGHERFTRLDDLATLAAADLHDRQLVETFVDRIEVNPDAKTGVVYLTADRECALLRSSTLLPGGDDRAPNVPNASRMSYLQGSAGTLKPNAVAAGFAPTE